MATNFVLACTDYLYNYTHAHSETITLTPSLTLTLTSTPTLTHTLIPTSTFYLIGGRKSVDWVTETESYWESHRHGFSYRLGLESSGESNLISIFNFYFFCVSFRLGLESSGVSDLDFFVGCWIKWNKRKEKKTKSIQSL